jgi:hypothetical protein
MGDLAEEMKNGRSAMWLCTQAAYAVVFGTSSERKDMNRYVATTASVVGRILASLVVFWLLALAAVQTAERWLGGWPSTEVGLLIAEGIAAVLAIRLRATVAAFIVLGFAAFTTAELVIHLTYGIRAAQGAATHFAVMGAGVLGVALGAIVATRVRRVQTIVR